MSTARLLWKPTPAQQSRSQMYAFVQDVARRHGVQPEWEAVRAWAIARPAEFWADLLAFTGIQPSAPARAAKEGAGMRGTHWFPGMQLNYARHLLRGPEVPPTPQNPALAGAAFGDEADAILWFTERGDHGRYSRGELRAAVAACQAGLLAAGVQQGDRVAGFMPNLPETVIAMLATASRGAIWSSCSPDFGVQGVLDRFGQIEPKVLFACDGYTYGGKPIETLTRLREMLPKLPSVKQVVVIPYLARGAARGGGAATGNPPAWQGGAGGGALAGLPGAVLWDAFLTAGQRGHPARPGPIADELHAPETAGGQGARASHSRAAASSREVRAAPPGAAAPVFVEVPFDHPLFIMYSSGTTGVPKCIVHGHGGTLLQHMKELMLHTDLRPGEKLFYFTTCGWMMWNWLVSGLGAGAAIVLYEGNPGHPTLDRLWQLAADTQLDVFGTSAKYLAACEKADLHPGRDHDLTRLRAICSTGSPLSAELFEWTYARVKRDLMLASICGGTDIISCFILGNPLLPVYAGEVQCRGLGMDVQAWDDAGRAVYNQQGELVCCTPFPCQPVRFWNDPDGEKYRAAYFDYYADRDVWRHGDWIEINADTGGIVVLGRSDATLNPGGVRIGTAEIYRVVEGIPEVVDSLVVGKDTADQDVEICLFVVLRPGETLTDELQQRIRSAIAAQCTKRHVPKHIRQVHDIPYTISGKKVELAVRRILHGQDVPNQDALKNPEALSEYRGIV